MQSWSRANCNGTCKWFQRQSWWAGKCWFAMNFRSARRSIRQAMTPCKVRVWSQICRFWKLEKLRSKISYEMHEIFTLWKTLEESRRENLPRFAANNAAKRQLSVFVHLSELFSSWRILESSYSPGASRDCWLSTFRCNLHRKEWFLRNCQSR